MSTTLEAKVVDSRRPDLTPVAGITTKCSRHWNFIFGRESPESPESPELWNLTPPLRIYYCQQPKVFLELWLETNLLPNWVGFPRLATPSAEQTPCLLTSLSRWPRSFGNPQTLQLFNYWFMWGQYIMAALKTSFFSAHPRVWVSGSFLKEPKISWERSVVFARTVLQLC